MLSMIAWAGPTTIDYAKRIDRHTNEDYKPPKRESRRKTEEKEKTDKCATIDRKGGEM